MIASQYPPFGVACVSFKDHSGAKGMNSDAMTGLGQRIVICEKIAGSRSALAAKTGIAARTLENYSHGRNDPKAAACVAIARATGVSIEWLLTGKGDPSVEAEEGDRKIVYNIAYFLARSSKAVKADPEEFADSFLSLYDYCREKQQSGSETFDARAFENVVEFASKRFQKNSA